jgi:antitoxin MazE
MQSKIQRWGNSQAIRLPKILLETARLEENAPVQLFAEQDMIIVKKVNVRRHKTLKERLEGFEGGYIFEEWNTGPAAGREIIDD